MRCLKRTLLFSRFFCVICHPEAPTSHTGEPSSPDAQSQELRGLLSHLLHLILLRHSCSCYSCWNSQVSIWIQKTGYDTVNAVGLNMFFFPFNLLLFILILQLSQGWRWSERYFVVLELSLFVAPLALTNSTGRCCQSTSKQLSG